VELNEVERLMSRATFRHKLVRYLLAFMLFILINGESANDRIRVNP